MTKPLPYSGKVAKLLGSRRYDLASELCVLKKISNEHIFRFIDSQIKRVPGLIDGEMYEEARDICIDSIGIVDSPVIIDILFKPASRGVLRDYLVEVHKRGRSNKQLTSLLFNLFVESQSRKELSDFVTMIKRVQTDKKKNRDVPNSPSSLQPTDPSIDHYRFLKNFDVEVALEMLNRYGMEEESLALSKAVGISTHLISSMINQEKKYFEAATEIFHHYDEPIGRTLLMKFGPALLKADPTAGKIIEQTAAEMWRLSFDGNDSQYISIFWGFPKNCYRFLKNVISERPTPLFVNVFAELLIPNENSTSESFFGNPAVSNADMAVAALSNKLYPIDVDHLLCVCAEVNFHRGVVTLLCRANRTKESLDYLFSKCSVSDTIRFLQTSPKLDSNDWARLLRYFVEQDNVEDLETLKKVLVNSMNTLSLSYITSCLLKKPSLPVSLVLECMKQKAVSTAQELDAAQSENQRLSKEISIARNETNRLLSSTYEVTARVCSHCDEELSVPIVGFLCGHAFHMKCSGSYCSVCGPPQTYREEESLKIENKFWPLSQ